MAVLSSPLLLSMLSTFNLLVAYYLLTSPSTLAQHNSVLLLGNSLRLNSASSSLYMAHPLSSSGTSSAKQACADPFVHPNSATSLAALFLAAFSLTDLFSVLGLASGEESLVYHAYWGLQIPVRLAGCFALLAWLYVSDKTGAATASTGAGGLAELKNGLVFTWAFVQLFGLFWTFSTLRQERGDIAVKRAKKEEARLKMESDFTT